MSDNDLDKTALELISSVKSAMLEHLGTDRLMQRSVELIGDAIGCECITYQAIDTNGHIVGGVHHPANNDDGLNLIPVINQYMGEHPIIPTILKNHTSFRPLLTTDFIEIEKFRETNLYQNAYVHLGWTYQMVAGLWDRSETSHSIALNRSHSDFDERDRSIFERLFPAFLKAMKCNHLINERLNQLRTNVKLTQRESEVLHWVAEGKTNPEIADILGSSGRTIDTHCTRLFAKLGFENRGAAIKYVSVMKRLTFNSEDAT